MNKLLKAGSLTGFVPHRLQIPDRPELAVFPSNVLFEKSLIKNQQTISAWALYEPDLSSFKIAKKQLSLIYRNLYDGDNQLIIDFTPDSQVYNASKLIKGQSVLSSRGVGWSMFFAQLTMFGLVRGEGVWFEVYASKC